MPLGRKTYDGDFPGGSFSTVKRRDSFDSKSKVNRNAAGKRTKRIVRVPDVEENLFADDSNKDRYLITYADLITLLLGLFIILYAISNIDIQKYEKMMSSMGHIFGGANVINSETTGNKISVEPIDELKNELNSIIEKHNSGNSISVERNERGLTLHILDDILFPSGSAELNSGSKEILSKLAAIIKNLPNDIRVEGHTDNIPIKTAQYPSNWHLSVTRALNTAYYLIDSENLNPDKVAIVGYAEYQPIESNLTEYGRAKNRRVDIVITNK
jgi:chemotaxis protein MotB